MLKLETIRNLLWAWIVLNMFVGVTVKFGIGYENVHWILVGPRMVFSVIVMVALTGFYLYQWGSRRAPDPYKGIGGAYQWHKPESDRDYIYTPPTQP